MAGERFYPKGYIGSEAAILLVAKTRDPSRWTSEKILSDEQAVWDGLGKTLNAEFIWNHLNFLKKDERRANDASMIDRLSDFQEAKNELRKSLFAGEIVAYFCDESGKMGFILKEGWGGDPGADILSRGIVDLEDGWRRLILLKADEIERLAKSLPPAWVYDDVEPEKNATSKDRSLKRPAVEKRKAFEKWRASLEGRIPTGAEDIAAMKAIAINRDDARELRKAYPRLPRGKPRVLKIGGG